jgi:Uma2 family endonuclease
MDAIRVTLTYADYAALPDDGRRYEIHGGELSETPAPSPRHQKVALNLAAALDAHVKANQLGEVFISPIDVILSDSTIVQPDILFLARDRLRLISERGIEGAPTLVVEILSPSTTQIDRQTKMQLYARHGVPWYWIVDPEARTIEVHALREGGYVPAARGAGDEVVRAEPLPDLALPLAALWA